MTMSLKPIKNYNTSLEKIHLLRPLQLTISLIEYIQCVPSLA